MTPDARSEGYTAFLERKLHLGGEWGFEPSLPDFLFDFQAALVEWSARKGRAAIFADCGLGKTPMQLAWAQAVAVRENKRVLILTPLAVAPQLLAEAEKFGIWAERHRPGESARSNGPIFVTNYERLHHLDPADFIGIVCDESSILKSFDGTRRKAITEFMRKMPYRLLCTATAAPNDYIELGTSSEALGEMGYMDVLNRFFRNEQGTADTGRTWGGVANWRFKGHAEEPFWRWVCSWARALRKPSDLGFDDADFELPELREREHVVKATAPNPDKLFDLPAASLYEEREERRRTLTERCEKVAELVDHPDQALVWCHLNAEGDLLSKLIPDAEQVQGSDSDEDKEAKLLAFANGDLRVLVTKPKIGAWGLNLQGCHHITFFPSHSYEQYYQGLRRCWRFGQEHPVTVDIIATEGEVGVKNNLRRKAEQADRMFTALVRHMNDALEFEDSGFTQTEEVPAWL